MPNDVKDNIIKLAINLQTIRDAINKPIHITNAYRCESHNNAVGGVKSSQHLLGKAADIQVKGMKPKQVYDLIENLIENGEVLQGGLGLYKTFIHLDIRRTKARWKI
jgi:uncharacterized protein YcbK (DUF882 family)